MLVVSLKVFSRAQKPPTSLFWRLKIMEGLELRLFIFYFPVKIPYAKNHSNRDFLFFHVGMYFSFFFFVCSSNQDFLASLCMLSSLLKILTFLNHLNQKKAVKLFSFSSFCFRYPLGLHFPLCLLNFQKIKFGMK